MHDRLYYAYMISSRSRTLYVGVTGNLHKRIFEHKRKWYEGFSATYQCTGLSGTSGLSAWKMPSHERSG